MYSNIGGKIKGLAIATFIVEAIMAVLSGAVCVLGGLFSLIDGLTGYYSYFDEEMILVMLMGLAVIVIGPIIAWVSSWMLYGFGELISKTTEIARNTRTEVKKSEAQTKLDAERISRIEKLRSQGLITEAEYQQAVSKER
ncbi:MAG: hypothetical protein IKU82_04775 [Clostridia bacterium]|nr:hypothetical protein [Clostridia bacterium]